jgi:hypothetical protein
MSSEPNYGQRREREKKKLERLKKIREIVRLAPEPLSFKQIREYFPNESERQVARYLSELVELEIISYDKKEKTYWISNVELVQASEEQMKALSKITYEALSPAIGNLVALAKKLDAKNLGRMSDKRALSYMLDRVNREILKGSGKKKK